jgi:mono/diheme cytochrome c family protein
VRSRGWAVVWLVAMLAGCGGSSGEGAAAFQNFNPGTTPDSLRQGATIFNTYCISCHGRHATGQGLGPPLLDTLYAPDRLPDEAIYQAVELGVNQNHWHYGAMPKIQRLGRSEVGEIIPYLRWLQRRATPPAAPAPGGR